MRIYDANRNPHDYCADCSPAEPEDGYDDHPPYTDVDYICEYCKKPLTDEDD